MTIEIEVRGLEAVRGKLQQADVDRMIEVTMVKAMDWVLGEVPAYPPKPEGSKYRRTMKLGQSITVDVRALGSETVGVIGSNREYAPDVIKEGEQRPVHEGRWWTLEGVVKKNVKGIEEFFRKAVEELVRKANG